MSTINEPQPESPAPVPEELVAYLDGELSPEECRQIEERLAVDADYRQQLRDLDQAWEALDSLPSTAVDDDFARTTIEMVALAAQEEQSQRASEVATTTRWRRLWWTVGGAAALAASFVAGRMLLPSADATLLRDLPVIWQMDRLDQIKDAAFLRRLSNEVRPDQLAADDAAVAEDVKEIQAVTDATLQSRREWIASLPSDDKAVLAARQSEFEKLRPDERDRLQKLEREIAAASDAEKLQKTLSAYGQWLARRTSSERSRLRNFATDDERIRNIREIAKREDRLAAQKLSPEDVKELREEIFEIYQERRDEFLNAMRRFENNKRLRRPEGPHDGMALVVATWALRNLDIDDRTLKRIVEELTPAAQAHMKQLLEQRGGERRAKTQLWQWMREAMRPQREPGDIERFFASDELKDEQRERLLSLPKDQMDAELERMFLGAQFGLQGPQWFGNDRPGPPPGEGPFMGPPGGPLGPPPPDGFEGREGQRFERDRRGEGPDGRRGRGDRRDGRPRPDGGPPPPPRNGERDDPA